MFVDLPTVLRLIGGTPHFHTASVFAEKLKITKALLGGGDLSGMLKDVMQNGLQAILKNPMAQALSQLKTSVFEAISQVAAPEGEDPNFPATLAALGDAASGLMKAADAAIAHTNGISGMGGGAFTLYDLVAHANLIGIVGGAVDEAIGMATVVKPLNMDSELAAMNEGLPLLIEHVRTGAITDEDAGAEIDAMAAALTAPVEASANALSTGIAATLAIASAAVATSAFNLNSPELAASVTRMLGAERAAEIVDLQSQFFDIGEDA
ncbi:MAG: hypothetical protein KDK08_05770 [Rhizobiaceae bacterium]|nr:hypothetical protein [Rhizobiaceae bacterium]MCC0000968.1 hypothetical protein [Methylobacteriaceae bacterium]